MADRLTEKDFKTVLSLDPLLDFWRTQVAPQCSYMSEMFKVFEQRVADAPDLRGEITDAAVAEAHMEIIGPLMTVAFPSSTRQTEISGALVPFRHQAFFCTPLYRKLLMSEGGGISGSLKSTFHSVDRQRRLRAYALILERLYGIDKGVQSPLTRIIKDPDSGLERHFQIIPDFQFVQVATVGPPHALSETDRKLVIEHIAEPDVLATILPPEKFEFRGFTIVRAVDVTATEIISALERDLIDQESIFSADGFRRLQDRLRVFFGRADLRAGLGALQGDQVLILNDGHHSRGNCLFRNSNHIPITELENSVWLQAVEQEKILRIADLSAEPNLTPAEINSVEAGARSMLIAPLRYGAETIGTFQIRTPRSNDLGATDAEKMRHIAPLFSMALKRGLDEMNNEVQAIIKEKCTAVHPSVEWRFRQAALAHMERLRRGEPSEMASIIFQDVVPLFAQTDIRGSSEARVESIQADLTEQLRQAAKVMARAAEARSWPLLEEYNHRIESRMAQIKAGLSSEDEAMVAGFLRNEIEPAFDELRALGPKVSQAIDAYTQALDPNLAMVYRKRRDFEQSVSMLNERLSVYLDQQQVEAQATYPHYFEKHQTDGIDYVIYLGASMHPEGRLNPLYVKNLTLWQFMVTLGMAWHSEQVKPQLKVPLETCHLILVNRTPLSIRFRYDEKRFDVDGAYDIRQEIIKARLDKAMVKGGRERLTQPGRIAVVYSHAREGREIRQHIDYLQSRGYLLNDLETVDLENLPGIRGLKALRVGVDLQAAALPRGLERMAG
jgi:GAF domain